MLLNVKLAIEHLPVAISVGGKGNGPCNEECILSVLDRLRWEMVETLAEAFVPSREVVTVEDSWLLWLGIGGGGGNMHEAGLLLPTFGNKQPPLSLWSRLGGSGGAMEDITSLLDAFDDICTIEFELDDEAEVVTAFEDKLEVTWVIVAFTTAPLFELGDVVTCELAWPDNLTDEWMDGLCLGDELLRLITCKYRRHNNFDWHFFTKLQSILFYDYR